VVAGGGPLLSMMMFVLTEMMMIVRLWMTIFFFASFFHRPCPFAILLEQCFLNTVVFGMQLYIDIDAEKDADFAELLLTMVLSAAAAVLVGGRNLWGRVSEAPANRGENWRLSAAALLLSLSSSL
jgi:hypothetical protein